MATGLHADDGNKLVDILDRLAADIGVHCRKAQREVGSLKLANIPGDVVQVFSLTDNLLSFIGKCLMAGMSQSCSLPTVPLHVKLSLFERMKVQAQSMELHESNVNSIGIPFHFAATATEANRCHMSHDQYVAQKDINPAWMFCQC